MFGMPSKSAAPYLLFLGANEVFRLPPATRSVQVLSGLAWLTVAGEDIILASNEAASLTDFQDVALISAASEQPLLLKVV